jgi:hypothetical protein
MTPNVQIIVVMGLSSIVLSKPLSIRMPTTPTQMGAMTNAIQKLPVNSMRYQATTAPNIKRAPWAILMICRRPKIIFKPRAMRAMIKPQTTAFKNAMDRLEITDGSFKVL